MRVLCLADLHRLEYDRLAMREQDAWIEGLLAAHDPDVVAIAGDVFDEQSELAPYPELSRLFPDRPVVCTLGNHEFFGRTVREVLDRYEALYDPARWNVHYLDIVDSFDVGSVRFFGNVLWYDGSMATVPDQDVGTFAGKRWRDYEIVDFDWEGECRKCTEAILENQSGPDQTGFLLTHCVPHPGLNGHMFKAYSEFNAFSGVSWLLDRVRAEVAVCGHTHWRIPETVINGARCLNVGNDYVPPFRHAVLDV